MKCQAPAYSAAAFCRMDASIVQAVRDPAACREVARSASIVILVGSLCFGFAFGLWRSPLQACYAAVKMPLMIFLTVGVGALINTMMAQLLHAELSLRQTVTCCLLGFAVVMALLGAMSPVLAYFALALPSHDAPDAMLVYRALLLGVTALVAVCGVAGNTRLYGLLAGLVDQRRRAITVLTAWILVLGLTGSQLSWLVSPFLARPHEPVPVLNPNAFRSNFFEYCWRMANDGG